MAALLTEVHRHDVTQLLPLLAAIPPMRDTHGRPRRRPRRMRGAVATKRSLTGRSYERWELSPCWPHAGQPMVVA